MKFCNICAYPENHALGISFDESGTCSGCIIHREKFQLDWADRKQKLSNILSHYKLKSSANYDCIIPVTGGKDSFFIVDLIKHEFGLKPLLVSFNRHYNTRGGIYNLEHMRTEIGCDIITMTMKPETTFKLMRHSFERLGSIHWPYLAGSTVFPVQMAVKKNIPLIIWGAHQGIDQVGMFSHLDEVEMTRRYRHEHDLLGLEPEQVPSDVPDEISETDVKPLFYPEDTALQKVGVRGIYLNNYLLWDTKTQHETMQKKYNIYSSKQKRTFDTYNDVDCIHYNNLHDYIKFCKFGYSKINDHVAREIRFGRITLDQGLFLIQKYQNFEDIKLSDASRAIGLQENTFKSILKRHTRKFKKSSCRRDALTENASKLANRFCREFFENKPERIMDSHQQHRLLMRGGF